MTSTALTSSSPFVYVGGPVKPALMTVPVIARAAQTFEMYDPNAGSLAEWQELAMKEIRQEVEDKLLVCARDQRYVLYIYAPAQRFVRECEQMLERLVGSSQQRFKVLLEEFE